MMNNENVWGRILKFIFHNIGICVLILVIVILMLGHLANGETASKISIIFMLFLSFVLKNALTYKSLYDTDLIRTFTKNKKYTIPFVLFDSVIVVLFCVCIYIYKDISELLTLLYFILMSISFSIYSLMFIRKIKILCTTEKRRNILKIIVKLFTLSFYLLAYSFVLCNFIHPISSLVQSMFFRFILVLITTFICVFVENVVSALIYLYLNIVKHISDEVKKKMIITFLIESVIMVILFMGIYKFIVEF